MKKIIAMILALLFGLRLENFAQNGSTMHFMRLNPYQSYANPAFFTPFKGYVGFPAASNINVSLYNTSLHYKYLFDTYLGKPVSVNANRLVNSLCKGGNWINTDMNLNILDFGFRVKRLFFSFSYRMRINEALRFSKDLIALPVKGNLNYLGANNAANLDLRLNVNAYTEFGFGVQAEIDKHWYVGAKPKLLFGLANFHTRKMNARVFTDEIDYALKIDYNVDADMMCIVPLVFNNSDLIPEIGEMGGGLHIVRSLFKNAGAAIDLGVVYRINDKFGVAASITDLGFICWKGQGGRIAGSVGNAGTYYDDGQFVFSGLDAGEVENFDDYIDKISGELTTYFPIKGIPIKKYTTALPARFIVEGYCNLKKYHRLTALFQGEIMNQSFLPAFTIAYDGNFIDIFDICVRYTLSKRNFLNLGVGLGFNFRVFQIYVATDNILSVLNSSAIRGLMNSTSVNAQLGIVFNWGKVLEQKIQTIEKVDTREQPPAYSVDS